MNAENIIDKTVGKNIPMLLQSRVKLCPDFILQAAKDKNGHYVMYSYKEVYKRVIEFAVALKKIGVKRGDLVALIADNRREWFITDMALLSLGAADVPRGCDSMGNEIRFIIAYTECSMGFFENEAQLCKVLEAKKEVPLLKKAILYDEISPATRIAAEHAGIEVIYFADLEKLGAAATNSQREAIEREIEKTQPDELATIIFTSGTTGVPKGVMLTHDNFIAQAEVANSVLKTKGGQLWLSILPVWHSFERVFQYLVMAVNSGMAYSKPIAAVMLADMAVIKPYSIFGVPRLWESLAQGILRTMKKTGGVKYGMFKFFLSVGKKYTWSRERVKGLVCQIKPRNRFVDKIVGFIPYVLLAPLYTLGDILVFKKIKAKLGGKMTFAISGGGALQTETDAFYRAIGFTLLEGYGMTESAPVLSVRYPSCPRSGCVGHVYPSAEIKVVAENHGEITSSAPLSPGYQGLILARGRQIMKGYYKRPDLTAKVIDKDGWLNTGDLGMMTYDNEIKITGRAKDTIVLLGGENIEPQVIESSLLGSSFIESAVVLGQDKKYLGALIVPTKDSVLAYSKEQKIQAASYEDLLENPKIMDVIRKEIDNRISSATGFRTCERIYRFTLLPESFSVGKELSGKQEMMRHKIADIYKEKIEKLFA